MRAEDLERELARQTANKQPHQQHQHPGMNNQMPNHHQYLPRQGSFSGGMPNNHSQMNRPFQRPFGSPGLCHSNCYYFFSFSNLILFTHMIQ